MEKSYAYQCAEAALSLSGVKNPADVHRIALDFEARYAEVAETNYVSDEWAAYLRDIGGYANFHPYVAGLHAGDHCARLRRLDAEYNTSPLSPLHHDNRCRS